MQGGSVRCNKFFISTEMFTAVSLLTASSQANFLQWTQDTSATLVSADPSNFAQTVADLCGSGKLQIHRQQDKTGKAAEIMQRYTIAFGDSCQPLDIVGTRFDIQSTKLLASRQLKPLTPGSVGMLIK